MTQRRGRSPRATEGSDHRRHEEHQPDRPPDQEGLSARSEQLQRREYQWAAQEHGERTAPPPEAGAQSVTQWAPPFRLQTFPALTSQSGLAAERSHWPARITPWVLKQGSLQVLPSRSPQSPQPWSDPFTKPEVALQIDFRNHLPRKLAPRRHKNRKRLWIMLSLCDKIRRNFCRIAKLGEKLLNTAFLIV